MSRSPCRVRTTPASLPSVSTTRLIASFSSTSWCSYLTSSWSPLTRRTRRTIAPMLKHLRTPLRIRVASNCRRQPSDIGVGCTVRRNQSPPWKHPQFGADVANAPLAQLRLLQAHTQRPRATAASFSVPTLTTARSLHQHRPKTGTSEENARECQSPWDEFCTSSGLALAGRAGAPACPARQHERAARLGTLEPSIVLAAAGLRS
jgi:hypothetical protein